MGGARIDVAVGGPTRIDVVVLGVLQERGVSGKRTKTVASTVPALVALSMSQVIDSYLPGGVSI